uniref:Uncharacterized protein n=1 Tax=Panagrolaimus sp. PS1159 TaxID=55785 RepID=A0AC35FXZ4_9BILA
MATTIQECASLSAAERRQKRIERILGTANDRLEKIQPGSSTALDASDHMYISARDADLINASFKLDDTQEDSFKLDATQEESGLEQTINTTAEIDFVEPSYMDLIDINRVQACVIAGAMLRILTFFHVIHSASPIWIPLSLAYHTYSLIQVEKKFPKHGYIVNFLLAGGMSEKLVRYLGLGIDTLWSFAMDSLIMAFGFLSVHIGFLLFL